MTLLERFDKYDMKHVTTKEIRRAIAIAQAVDEIDKRHGGLEITQIIMRRADELLEKK